MAQDEGDLLLGTEIGEPVPGEEALDGDDEVGAVRSNGLEKGRGICGEVTVDQDLPFPVHDADVHRSGVEIDAAVVLMLLGVESH